ncbi:MAG: DUF503 domain-containing protein [Myxococcales bacterium]|nr:DUF503 domain-containing protein [Myxococcales bacterium]
MIVGVCRVELSLPGNDSLKGKRAVVRRALDRIRARFEISAAEVDLQDHHRRAVLGFAVVSSNGRIANRILDQVVAYLEKDGGAPIVSREMELVHFGDEALGEGAGGWDDGSI